MVTCQQCIDAFLAYLDGDLPPEAREHISEHLEECPPCEDFLKSYVRTPQLVRQALDTRMPPAAVTRLHEALHETLDAALRRKA